MIDLKLRLVKLIHACLKKVGHGGSLPGQVGLMMDKDFIGRFRMPENVILVTGTNGKTTTSNLIAESLRACGLKVLNNHRGDNLNVGIATLLATGSNMKYEINYDAVVIEVDELTLFRQFYNLHPSMLVVTNFFRDQLDRAGEMETIIRKIIELVKDFEGDLVLNGDDPNVLRLAEHAPKAKVHFFSVGPNETTVKTTDEASEGKFCPRCGNPLQYSYYQYSHIGRFHCEKDGFGEIQPDIYVDDIDYKTGMFQVDKQWYHSYINAIYTIYNCAAVLTVLKTMQLPMKQADSVFENYELKEGRNEVFQLQKPCTIDLIKNPTGANEVMKAITKETKPMNVCIILNDNDQDGHDVSWIWDAHFERLDKENIQTILCTGTRGYDMALRLKYDGLEKNVKVFEQVKDAIHYLNEADLESYVMSTYTALHSTRAILKKEEKK